MQNLITRVGYETRMALESQTAMNQALKRPVDEVSDSTVRRINGAAEALLTYLLFTDEAPLEGRSQALPALRPNSRRKAPRTARAVPSASSSSPDGCSSIPAAI